MRRCTAAFEDGHLLFGAPVRLPQVALGFGLRIAEGGRIVIANREKKLVSYLAKVSGLRGIEQILAVGNEVLEIDGRPAAEWVEELARHVPASSRGARLERAVDAVTRRDFVYPQRRTATIAVSVRGARRVVELPWWISPDAAGNVLTQRYVRRTGIATTNLLAWRYDQSKDTWDRDPQAAQGYLRTDPILPPRDAATLTEYLDEGGHVAVRVGQVVRRRDRVFCYVQVLSFHTELLHAGREEPRPFTAVLERFVGECKDKDLDLVVDLRHNAGGYIAHSSAVFAMLSGPGEAYPGGALVLRATTQNQLVYQQRMPAASAASAGAEETRSRPANRRGNRPRAPRAARLHARFPGRPGARERRRGWLLRAGWWRSTSPSCMSACDRLAGLLRSSRRALLAGRSDGGRGRQPAGGAQPGRALVGITDRRLVAVYPERRHGRPAARRRRAARRARRADGGGVLRGPRVREPPRPAGRAVLDLARGHHRPQPRLARAGRGGPLRGPTRPRRHRGVLKNRRPTSLPGADTQRRDRPRTDSRDLQRRDHGETPRSPPAPGPSAARPSRRSRASGARSTGDPR